MKNNWIKFHSKIYSFLRAFKVFLSSVLLENDLVTALSSSSVKHLLDCENPFEQLLTLITHTNKKRGIPDQKQTRKDKKWLKRIKKTLHHLYLCSKPHTKNPRLVGWYFKNRLHFFSFYLCLVSYHVLGKKKYYIYTFLWYKSCCFIFANISKVLCVKVR